LTFRFARAIDDLRTQIRLSREIDANEERLNIDLLAPSDLRLRLSVWTTGDWWLLACQTAPGRSEGWLFKHVLRGVLDHAPPASIVKSFEDSRLVRQWKPEERLTRLRGIWHLEPQNPGRAGG
jgi:hypothetical protein